MFEPFIGWAAAFIPKDYVKAAAEFAHENEIILAFDEVQEIVDSESNEVLATEDEKPKEDSKDGQITLEL